MPRKQHDYHFIYKTVNLVNEKFYIGMHSTSNLKDGYIGSGKRLWYSIKKYGRENFKMEILEFLPDRSSLKLRESEIVNIELLNDFNCMNLKLGGEGGFPEHCKFGNLDEDQHKKRSILGGKSSLGKIKPSSSLNMKNLHKEGKIKIPNWSGKTHSEESIQKMRISKQGHGVGEKNSQYGTVWINKEDENKKIKKENLDEFVKNGWSRGRK
jgi:hypothetical protein